MLSAMDAAPALWLALGAVLLGLTGLLAAPVGRGRPRPARPVTASAAPPPRGAFPDDDLPAFRLLPPGTPGEPPPGAVPAPARARARVAPAPHDDATDGPSTGRVLAAMAVAALALVALLAGVASLDADPDPEPGGTPGGPAARTTAGPTAGNSTTSTPPRLPALPPPPTDPAPGEAGAGALAVVSVPLDAGGHAARLAFAPLVLERRAVGVTVAVPTVGVTARSDGTALAHLRLPTWNCLMPWAPVDPAAAGCSPGPVEYADLPSPALRSSAENGGLRLTGRFPTYTRPAGGPPAYTGRVYEFAVTLAADGPAAEDAWVPARGTLFLGTERAESLPDPAVSAVRRGG
ncbi:hypothetical protein [Trujillonella endophytica]|uniref:Uncharacterized protein n=1 Tax=Trujillonella endophytica TaxID=673521 RepID=A0A1H8RY28_9ACTN|nr:hypothetical protein [Trujillella endophytica]SEO71048.1 hypothetical protein SAMN05660991_01404 [Trujillella endophytica]